MGSFAASPVKRGTFILILKTWSSGVKSKPGPLGQDSLLNWGGEQALFGSVKASLGFRVKGRDVIERGEGYQLRENPTPYKALFEAKNEDIGLKNTHFGDIKVE